MSTDPAKDRVRREQAFHDARFTLENRGQEEKFYSALEDAFSRYWELVGSASVGRDVLEYGCGNGANSLRIAAGARRLVGIDISPVAVAQAQDHAEAAEAENARFEVMNAEAMTFPDASFDLAYGSGILHHLDLVKSFSELKRVLRPGGSCIFMEPFGHNALINLYRRLTPAARTPDEHPLLRHDIVLAGQYFRSIRVEFFALSQLAAVPFRNTPLRRIALRITRSIDAILLRHPTARWYAWTGILVFER